MPGAAFAYALRPAGHAVRIARSLSAALVCVVTAAVGHLSAGGTIPATAVVAAFAGSAGIAWLLSARRVTSGQLVGLLVLCQVGVHLGDSTAGMRMSTTMIAAHLVATAVSALALSRGEAFAWQLAERLGLRVAPHELIGTSIPFWRAPTPVVATRSIHDAHLAHTRVERGPPTGH